MTRINTIAVTELSNKHLMAEYKELPRIFTAVLKHQDAGKTPADFNIPEQYKLGTGHMTFFYDKCGYLYKRYGQIWNELLKRDYKLDGELINKIMKDAQRINGHFMNDWTPTPEDKYLNMARLVKRSEFDNAKAEALSDA